MFCTVVPQADELPVAPVTLPGSLAGSVAATPRNVRINTSYDGMGLTGRQHSRDDSDSSFSSSHRSVMANRIKRSSSVILAA